MKLAIDACGNVAALLPGCRERSDNFNFNFDAAHSMDTDWYAVDRAGHVAKLCSGEEGAVPMDAHRQYWRELWEDLCWIRTLPRMPERGAILLAESSQSISVEQLPYQWDGVLLFQNRDYLVMFRDEYYHADWAVVDEDVANYAVKVRDVLGEGFKDYWQAGVITGAIVLPKDGGVLPRKVGLYEYECEFSGPYYRRHVPVQPIQIDELPPGLQKKLSGLRVTVRFESTPELNAEQLGKCFHYRS